MTWVGLPLWSQSFFLKECWKPAKGRGNSQNQLHLQALEMNSADLGRRQPSLLQNHWPKPLTQSCKGRLHSATGRLSLAQSALKNVPKVKTFRNWEISHNNLDSLLFLKTPRFGCFGPKFPNGYKQRILIITTSLRQTLTPRSPTRAHPVTCATCLISAGL